MIGNLNASAINIGNQPVSKVYIGPSIVYSNTQEEDTWDLTVQITGDNETFALSKSNPYSWAVAPTIYWGDGSSELFSSSLKAHNYETSGVYTVKISGSFHPDEYSTVTSAVSSFSLGLNPITNGRKVIKTSRIPYMSGLIGVNLSYAQITGLPNDFLTYNPQIANMPQAFYACDKLVSIPSGLFSANTGIESLFLTFSNCTGITAIPSNLFANNTNITSFSNTFSDCSGLTSIPSNLFANNKEVISFDYTFNNCSKLLNIPATLFYNNTKARTFFKTFNGCSGINSVSADLFRYNTQLSTSHMTNLSSKSGLFDVFGGMTLSSASYSDLLQSLLKYQASGQKLYGIDLGAGNSTCTSAGLLYRNKLVNDYGWLISDGDNNTAPESWSIDIETTGVNKTYSLSLSNPDPIIISWGDGTQNTMTSTGKVSHTYANTGLKNMTIKGACASLSLAFDISDGALVKRIGIMPTFTGIENFASVCDKTHINFIPQNIFQYNTGVSSFASAFSRTKIKSVPSGLFANTNVQNCQALFAGCDELTAVSPYVFRTYSESPYGQITNFDACFNDCTALFSIPAVFYNQTSATGFTIVFAGCTNLSTIGRYIFHNIGENVDFSSAFQNCHRLSTIPFDLFYSATNAKSFAYTFSNCSGLTNFSTDLFAYNRNIATSYNPNTFNYQGFDFTFNNIPLSTTTYSNLLQKMYYYQAVLGGLTNVRLGANLSKYNSTAATERNSLVNTYNWVIDDAGPE